MLNKKKLFIIIGLVLLMVIIIVLVLLLSGKKDTTDTSSSDQVSTENLYIPEFMQAEEKLRLGLPADSKIQILTKNESGETQVYKIIRRDADLVLDPTRVGDIDMIQPPKITE